MQSFLQAMQHGQNQRSLMPRLSSGAVAYVIQTNESVIYYIYSTSPVSEDGRKHKELMRKQTHNEGKQYKR